jgi:NTP pyrophosphatase (non-canonical NTP hydrolase)
MKNVSKKVQQYLRDRGWDKVPPGDLAKSISIEAAELLELFQWSNPSLKETLQDPEKVQEIKKELADIMIYCLDMSIHLRIDPEQMILEKLQHAEKKYPADLMRKRMKDKSGSRDEYLRIKKEYRRKGIN